MAEVNQDSTSAVREKIFGNVESARGKDECSGVVLRVLQWNVLADGLAQFGNFHRVEKGVLEWSSRAPLLLAQLLQDKPHIICLQELNHFDDWLYPELQKHGYDGMFGKKKWSPCKKYKFPADGCAIFYDTSRLQLLEQEVIAYKDAKGAFQGQGGQVCRLKDLEANEDIIVATTHLKAKGGARNEQMRILQAQQLLQRLKVASTDESTPVVICGDLNDEPKSEVYKTFHDDLQSVYALTCQCDPPHGEHTRLAGICETACDGGANAEPLYTTWKFRSDEGEKCRTIDYIWYKVQCKLRPCKRWPLPSQAEIGPSGLPSAVMPSDHLPLLCEFVWRTHSKLTSRRTPLPLACLLYLPGSQSEI